MSTSINDLVVTRIDPLKVSFYWPLLEYGLRYASPPGSEPTEEYITNALAGCLSNKMQCWIAFRKGKEKFIPIGTMVTRVDKASARGTNNLIVENLYGFGGVPGETWKTGMEVLMEFAKIQGCKRVIAYTHNSRVIEVSQVLKCDNVYSVLEWEVK